eukprot:3738485-Ditylum_brightwellii.AAC.1
MDDLMGGYRAKSMILWENAEQQVLALPKSLMDNVIGGCKATSTGPQSTRIDDLMGGSIATNICLEKIRMDNLMGGCRATSTSPKETWMDDLIKNA